MALEADSVCDSLDQDWQNFQAKGDFGDGGGAGPGQGGRGKKGLGEVKQQPGTPKNVIKAHVKTTAKAQAKRKAAGPKLCQG